MNNPLKPIAVVAVFSIALDLYQFIQGHEANWVAILRTVLFAGFLLLYLRTARLAWLASMLLFVAITPAYFFVLYITSPASLPSLAVSAMIAILFVLGVVYLFRIRYKYYSYLDKQSA